MQPVLLEQYQSLLRQREALTQQMTRIVSNPVLALREQNRVIKIDKERWDLHREMERIASDLGWPNPQERVEQDILAFHYSKGEGVMEPGLFLVPVDSQSSIRFGDDTLSSIDTSELVEDETSMRNGMVLVYDNVLRFGGDIAGHRTVNASLYPEEKERFMKKFVDMLHEAIPEAQAKLVVWKQGDYQGHAYNNIAFFGVWMQASATDRAMELFRQHREQLWFTEKEKPRISAREIEVKYTLHPGDEATFSHLPFITQDTQAIQADFQKIAEMVNNPSLSPLSKRNGADFHAQMKQKDMLKEQGLWFMDFVDIEVRSCVEDGKQKQQVFMRGYENGQGRELTREALHEVVTRVSKEWQENRELDERFQKEQELIEDWTPKKGRRI